MRTIFDIESENNTLPYHGRCSDIDPLSTIFPFEFEIDYVKQYKLDLKQCNLALPVITSQIDFEAFAVSPKVRKSIIISNDINVSSSIAVFGTKKVSLRAANYIEIIEGFEVDKYSEFFADVSDSSEGGCDEGF